MSAERILVVDDEEPIREIVTAMLQSSGYQCQQAASGKQALALLTSGAAFELVLSDLMMADMDGIGLLERTKEKYPDMPVVMVTAVHDISVALAAIRNGAYDYLLKPFEREQLLATVRGALENPFVMDGGRVRTVDHPSGPIRLLAASVTCPGEETPCQAAPAMGADTDAVLGEAGFTAAEIAELRRAGAV